MTQRDGIPNEAGSKAKKYYFPIMWIKIKIITENISS
jgi:hypothetical protein